MAPAVTTLCESHLLHQGHLPGKQQFPRLALDACLKEEETWAALRTLDDPLHTGLVERWFSTHPKKI